MASISKAQVTAIAEQAAECGVRRAFISMGLDASAPIQMQKDMAWVRAHRLASEKLGMRARLTLVGILISAGVTGLWFGIKAVLGK